jgi:hypothetical protein
MTIAALTATAMGIALLAAAPAKAQTDPKDAAEAAAAPKAPSNAVPAGAKRAQKSASRSVKAVATPSPAAETAPMIEPAAGKK